MVGDNRLYKGYRRFSVGSKLNKQVAVGLSLRKGFRQFLGLNDLTAVIRLDTIRPKYDVFKVPDQRSGIRRIDDFLQQVRHSAGRTPFHLKNLRLCKMEQ